MARWKFNGPRVWAMGRISPQDAQKVRPARPQRVKGRGVPSGYVEGLNGARTPLEDFFSILLETQETVVYNAIDGEMSVLLGG